MKGLGEQSDGAGRGAEDDRPGSATTGRIIACAIEVHRTLGPGLLESVYEAALCLEMGDAGLRYVCQQPVPIVYKGQVIAQHRLDLLVEDLVVVEVKSAARFDPVFEAQILTYMRLAEKPLGLLINFNSRLLKDGIKRYAL
jgi:GxxExxY protein